MLLLLLSLACRPTDTVTAPVVQHAQPIARAGTPLLRITPDQATVDGDEPVTPETIASVVSSAPRVFIATEPSVSWERTHAFIEALPETVSQVAFVVADDTPTDPSPASRSGVLDVAWLGSQYTLRHNVHQPMVTGGETRLLGTLSQTHTARILAGPERSAWEVIGVLDQAYSQDVACLRADVEVADNDPSTTLPSEAQIPVRDTVSALVIQRGDSARCTPLLGRLPAMQLQSSEDVAVRVDGGPLTAEQIEAALEPSRSTWEQCLGLARTQVPPVAQNEPAKAIAEVDIGTDGTVLGTIVMVGGEEAQARDTQERCLSRVMHSLTFDTQGQRARFLLTVAP